MFVSISTRIRTRRHRQLQLANHQLFGRIQMRHQRRRHWQQSRTPCLTQAAMKRIQARIALHLWGHARDLEWLL